MSKEKVYGIADKAWQPVVGCDPHMKCAPRCWARKTVARVVECQQTQAPNRAGFFRIALTPDLKQWSGEVFLDFSHLDDPLHWRKPAVIATGFHGDWGRLDERDIEMVLAVMALCPRHRFLPLTKQPEALVAFFSDLNYRTETVGISAEASSGLDRFHDDLSPRWPLPLRNVSIGCSIMDQADADLHREAMAALAAMGWATHVWYEPAIGPVNWKGWEFLLGMIVGFESGAKSRPGHPQWARDTRDWCVVNGVPFNFKQWGDWGMTAEHGFGGRRGPTHVFSTGDGYGAEMIRVGKKAAGRMLDGRTWDEVPRFERGAVV